MPLLIGGRRVLLISALKDAVTSRVGELAALIPARATFTIGKDGTTVRLTRTVRRHLVSSTARA